MPMTHIRDVLKNQRYVGSFFRDKARKTMRLKETMVDTGFATVEERDRFLREEAKYHVEVAVRALRVQVGHSEANKWLTEEVLKEVYVPKVF